ncbi:MAG: hypothetical protein NZ480_08330 [Bdellovibrionaceae bacterium]|nr:hypothetical protein [Pseudobdellovibrionaceae bacterium]MDW8190613.1 hypothetical protein [Pseudobdellovibrionaceae bacterium]
MEPGLRVNYGGWDQILRKVILNILSEGRDLFDELDANRVTRLIPIIAEYVTLLRKEALRSKHMNKYLTQLYEMGIDWSFRGERVSWSRISLIVESLDNTITVFADSTRILLYDLSRDPNSYDDLLFFAKNIDDTYKAEALNAFQLAKELESASYLSLFRTIVQRKASLSEIRSWNYRLSTVKNELGQFPMLEAVKKDIVELSVKRLSYDKDPSHLRAIYAALSNVIEPFTESTRKLIRDLTHSFESHQFESRCERYNDASSLINCANFEWFSKNNNGYLNPAYAGRYLNLALNFARYMELLRGRDFYMSRIRDKLWQAVFVGSTVLWSRCDAQSFQRKEATLNQQINEFIRANDRAKKWQLEIDIQNTLENCN